MKRIIVCDDEPHIVDGVRYLLRGPDRTVLGVHSGAEALELIESEVPDLLILDVMMPGMSGLEVAATLRAAPATKDMPIVIITAKGQASDAVQAESLWQAKVISKPFEPKALRQVVNEIVDGTPSPTTGTRS